MGSEESGILSRVNWMIDGCVRKRPSTLLNFFFFFGNFSNST